ncbi:MAG: NDP-sugar synthase [Acidobacteria bacterium]|nr:NDP-sugar synthase [Acidobacteriota bacterium]
MTEASGARSAGGATWPSMVLTAGVGTRLRPLSLLCAKPALPVAGVPLVGRILRWLSASGVRSTVLNLHHLPATITAAVGDGTGFGVQVRYSWERRLLGSAGGPARALPLLAADQFYVVNGDTLTDVNLAELAADHEQSSAQVTLALVANPDPLHYGGVTVDGTGRVTGFTPPGSANTGLHFVGVQAVNANVFVPLKKDVPAETITGIYREMMARRPGCVRAFVSEASFRDIGTAADYLDTCLDIARIEGAGDRLFGSGVAVADDARIANCVLWDDVRVGRGALLDWSVVAGGVSIPDGARYRRSVIRPSDGRPTEPGERVVGDLLVSPIDGFGRRAR